jgi:hypothetical protein
LGEKNSSADFIAKNWKTISSADFIEENLPKICCDNSLKKLKNSTKITKNLRK